MSAAGWGQPMATAETDQTERLSAALDVAAETTHRLAQIADGLQRHIDERAAAIAEATIRDVRAAAEVRVADAERLAADAEVRVAGMAAECQRQADVADERIRRHRVEVAALTSARDAAQRRADEADAARLQLRADLEQARAERDRYQAERDNVRAGLAEACRLLDSARVASWSPRAHPSRPLTAEQQRASEAGEGRTDWPVWVAPCDPAVSTDGDTLWVSCTGDDRADSEHPTSIVAVEPGDRWSELVAAVVAHRCGEVADVPRGSS